MPFTVVSLAEVRKSVTKRLNAAPDDNSWSFDTTDQGKYNPEFIRHNIRTSDADVVGTIIDTMGHPSRAQYISVVVPVSLADGDKIPAHMGETSKVEIKTVASPATWVIGTRAKNLEQILRWQEFPSLYGNGYGKYYIQDVFVKFCGLNLRVWVPDFQIDTTSNGGEGACQAPDRYTSTVEKGAMALLAMAGGYMDMHAFYTQQFQSDLARIMRKEMVVPQIEAFRRAGG